jgi:hypothetical protein
MTISALYLLTLLGFIHLRLLIPALPTSPPDISHVELTREPSEYHNQYDSNKHGTNITSGVECNQVKNTRCKLNSMYIRELFILTINDLNQ